MDKLVRLLGNSPDVWIVMLTVGILCVLFAPIPSWLLDGLLLLNLSLALFVLLLTFHVGKPVEFSTFPSVLLIATLFRLALNVAATRLILTDGEAGRVIAAIGAYVVGGNYVIGIIVFLILVVVQYVVVTSGAQRVAEVAARFTLDSMPGQQMSIDADLNMGFIDQETAQRRRKTIEQEAGFYGAMDGASKFVKGDAIAGIVILLINLVGGFAIGVAQHGLSWQASLQTYSLLTIGDGIVTQVPALVIAVGTGIIITRSSSDDRLSREVATQFSAYPDIMIMVGVALLLLAWLPGFPGTLTCLLALTLLGLALCLKRIRTGTAPVPAETAVTRPAEADALYDAMQVDTLSVGLGADLVPLMGENGALLLERIGLLRRQLALDLGLILPAVRVSDDRSLSGTGYRIVLCGSRVGEGRLRVGKWLAIHPGGDRPALEGEATTDPAYRLPAFWIDDAQRERARGLNYTVVDAATVFMTHFTELVRRYAAELLTREETERLLEHVRKSQPALVNELLPTVLSAGDVQRVLQSLLREKVSIRPLPLILEVLTDAARDSHDVDALTARVRQRLGNAICEGLLDPDGTLNVMTLDVAVEQTLYDGLRQVEDGQAGAISLDPRFAERLIQQLIGQSERMAGSNRMPVLLCAPECRVQVRRLAERMLPHLHVLAMTEVPSGVNLKSFAVVSC
ncbi:flagellar biosynthesis protein FlhA [Microvirgula aerodenitrificans]|uniref:flagellar biosynthesis protein FlhA n=1 Tax=Microvirgula aerodenitrificans TaxID=57480 RepID=UPI00048DCCA1|nr:flagellar biosynthesis protein FlhA [Microvirgula aerodenitrificans]